MATNSTRSSGGIDIYGMLFILFLVLKLTGHITWSWWWVTAPLWLPAAIIIFILVVAAFILAIK